MDYKLLRRKCEAARRDGNLQPLFEDIQDGFAAGHLHGSDFSIRKLFLATVPNGNEILESWDPENTSPISLNQADSMSLMESGATLSSAFSNITGQIVYNEVMQAYQDEAYVFTPLVRTVPTQFNGEKIPGITRLGDKFESIAENDPYPLASVKEDWIETPQTVKRGEIVPVSKEAVFFDRTGLILERCSELGHFYAGNKEKRIIDAIIDENVTTHRYKWQGTVYATFQTATPWINVKTSNGLVNWTNIDAAELVGSQLIDPHTGEPILINFKDLIVTRQLKNTARQIINAVEVRKGDGASNTAVTIGASPLETNYTVRSSALLASRLNTDTDWFIGDIGKAVRYMENWPMTITEAPPNSEREFTHDIVRQWKVSERGAAVVVEPRALLKSTVS